MRLLPRRAGISARLWAGASVLLAVVAVACLAVGVQLLRPSGVERPLGEAGSTALPSAAVVTPPVVAPPVVTSPVSTSPVVTAPVAPPVGLRIPAIDVAAGVIRVDLNEDRTVEVPSDPADTGWYRLGPPPGQPGSAVILGHVDSVQGPAVFYRLRYLEPGDEVVVDAADGTTSTFRVVRLATYPNESFPAQEVYAAAGPGRMLNLVTCGGDYDSNSGYQANLVVYTRWVRGA